MSGSVQYWVTALFLSAAVAGCGAKSADNSVSEAVHVGVSTMQRASVGHLQAIEVRDYLASHSDALVLDVRNTDEWNDELGHIEGARQIPLPELQDRLGEIESWKGKPVVVVCRSGSRSARAAELLAASGFQQVMNLEGGMTAWRQAENQTN
jgi:sulfur dioxygenase